MTSVCRPETKDKHYCSRSESRESESLFRVAWPSSATVFNATPTYTIDSALHYLVICAGQVDVGCRPAPADAQVLHTVQSKSSTFSSLGGNGEKVRAIHS